MSKLCILALILAGNNIKLHFLMSLVREMIQLGLKEMTVDIDDMLDVYFPFLTTLMMRLLPLFH